MTHLSIKVSEKQEVSALLTVPPGAKACYIMAHGAGAGMTHPFMAAVSDGLAERDVATLRYQFPYVENGSKRPDAPPLARATVPAAVAEASRRLPAVPLNGQKEPSTMEITTIGLDIAKRVFQVHGADATGKGQLRRKLQRADVLTFFASLPPCLVGIEARSTAHYWAREIRALGHEVRLMPASYVKHYVKRGKTEAADAEAICEAVTRPTMRFVPIKSAEQQAVLMLHRTRDLLVRQRTMLVNALRGHMAELGIIAPQGISRVGDLFAVLMGEDGAKLPKLARQALQGLAAELEAVGDRVKQIDAAIMAWHKENEASRCLATIPGIGPITASAIVATVTDPAQFQSARQFAAWIGLVPKQNSSGGKERCLWGHLLVAASGLAGGWCLRQFAPGVAATPAGGEQTRFQPGMRGFVIDSRKKGGSATGPNPADRGKPRTKRHLVTDRRGVPLAARLTGANAHDSTMLANKLDAIPSIGGKPGPPQRRPNKCHADKGYDYPVAAKLAAKAASSRVLPAIASRARKSSGGIAG